VFHASTVFVNTTLNLANDAILVGATSAVTITLESATASGADGKIVWIGVDHGSSTSVVTIDAPEAQLVDGTSTINMAVTGSSYQLVATNGHWKVLTHPEADLRTCIATNPIATVGQTGSGIPFELTMNFTRLEGDSSFCSFASNQITISETGKYEICAHLGSVNCSGKILVRSITDSVNLIHHAEIAEGYRVYECRQLEFTYAQTLELRFNGATSGTCSFQPDLSGIGPYGSESYVHHYLKIRKLR
jgi:hypothetical protein